MRYLYKGKTKIGKIHMKTKVNTSFITAGPEDIAAGKKSINNNYEEIIGTMDVNEVLTELTSDANATAADITAGKTGWVNGKQLTGTTVRDISKLLMPNGIVDTCKVKQGETINPGDFITTTKEIIGYVNHPTGVSNEINFQKSLSNPQLLKLTDTVTLLTYSEFGKELILYFINNDGKNITYKKSPTVITTSDYISNPTIIKLTDKKLLVTYTLSTNYYGACRILYLNDELNDITAGIEYKFESVDKVGLNSITRLTESSAVLAYTLNNLQVISKLVTINNNGTINFSARVIVGNEESNGVQICTLNETMALVTHAEMSYGIVTLLEKSNNTLIKREYFTISASGRLLASDTIHLTNNRCLIINSDRANTTISLIRFINGKLIVSSPVSLIDGKIMRTPAVIRISPCKVILCGTHTSYNNKISFIPINIGLNNFSVGNLLVTTYDNTITSYNANAFVRDNVIINLLYRGSYTYAKLYQINDDTISDNFVNSTPITEYVMSKHTIGNLINGVANTYAESNEIGNVIISNILDKEE